MREQRVEAVRRLGAARADDDRAEQAAEGVERVVRPVVVVRPGADRVRRALPLVREGLAGRDEAARARVLAHVGAVVLGAVLDAVRVHRDRLAQPPVGVAEVDDEHVADLGVQRRAGHVHAARGRREAGRHRPVDVGAERAAAGDPAVVPVVAPARDDVPAHRLGLDPVLAPHAAGLRLDLRELLGGDGARPAHAGGGGVGLRRVSGLATSTSSPPIVHSSAAPPATPRKERREVRSIGHGSARRLVRAYSLCKYVRTGYDGGVPTATGARADASERVRDAIVPATVRIVARDGVAAVTHRRVAARGRRLAVLDDVALRDQGRHPRRRAALDRAPRGRPHRRDRRPARRRAVRRRGVGRRAGRLARRAGHRRARPGDRAVPPPDGAARPPEAQAVHREWGEGLQALGDRVLDSATLSRARHAPDRGGARRPAAERDEHDGQDTEWLRPAVRRQLGALLG